MSAPVSQIVTLTTDFGLQDPFVGAMKGVMWRIHPRLQLVDITHQIEPYQILEAALVLPAFYPYYPVGTIHLVVVDPGVGGPRRPILAETRDYYFVAPDNGVLSMVYRDPAFQGVREITARHYFLEEISATFQGRDLFAPVAAWLASGVEPAGLGEEIQDYVRLAFPEPQWVGERELGGEILYVDRFGNLISNLPGSMIPGDRAGVRIRLGPIEIQGINRFYGEGPPGEPQAILNSWGTLEVYIDQGNAHRSLGMGKGQRLSVLLEP
ncbi:MAG: SAM-dependent chlorinase/fluorinase [Candidatus Tectomicrobia bacterium]|uniref:SAM-dependent chlorinase/fluorinase n=1 Tax=Tectimicrobiota bacterium TaxID=2528274 RepID=A0A932CPW5_UNCTE|nr:SAM-dependent chlorinase/fluorinase [Candidatus Tectomicrobia bacterium]